MSMLFVAAGGFLMAACERVPHAAVEKARPAEGLEALRRAAAALKATQTVEFDFVFGSPADPLGYVTGHTLMKRMNDANDGWIRVIGHVQQQPVFNRASRRFDYGLDAENARLVSLSDGRYDIAPRTAGANTLATDAMYGYLPEFIEARPFWKELTAAAKAELLEPETVGGVLCDVVRTTYVFDGRTVEVIWSIARSDKLPRRGRWVNSSYVAGTMTFTITNLRKGHRLMATDFVPPSDSASPMIRAPRSIVAVGDLVPEWDLPTVDGRRIRSKDLLGKIVVLDFWNTWCFVCRAIAPETRALQKELASQGVEFLGVNIFETGDAVAYWRRSGAPYTSATEGEELAAMLDISAQPAVAVIDATGRLRYTEVGATADRAAHICRAVESCRNTTE